MSGLAHPPPTGREPVPSDRDLLSAFENAPIGVAVLTTTGVITACNLAVERLVGRTAAQLVGTTFFDVTHPDDLAEAHRHCALIQTGEVDVVRHEARLRMPDGRTVWVSVSTSRVPATADREAHLIMHLADVSDRKQIEADLRDRALHDPLTGLANRTLLTERIQEALARRGVVSHLFYLDLNGFKAVNDQLGHAAGDAVLTQLADRIVGLLRPGDTAARIGGDEFAVLCEDTGPHCAAAVGERLRAAAAEPFVVEGATVRLSAAVGGCPARVADPATLLREADRSMYATKQRRTTVRGGGVPG